VSSKDKISSNQSIDDTLKDMEAILNPVSQPSTYIDFQIPDNSLEPEKNYDLIQKSSVPFCFKSFQVLKKTLGQVLRDEYLKGQEISFESI
jgi:hypothetical protein